MESDPNSTLRSESLQPDLYAAIVITLTLAVVAICLRFWARRLVRATLWIDDWLALAALFFAIGFTVDMVYFARTGVGLHIEAVNKDVNLIYHDFFLGLWIADLLYSFALAAAKLSILSFYWRIFQVKSIRLPIKILATLAICWLIMRILVTVFHCVPVQGFWDKSIEATCTVDDRKFYVGSVIPHLLMDLIILTLPVPYIKNLQISSRQKFGVLGMFLFGGFVCFASIFQLVVCIRLDVTSTDVTWIFAPIAIWATAEANLAVVAACLPLLRPIYRLAIHGSVKSQIQSSTPGSHPSGTWNNKSKRQTMARLQSVHSDSTHQFAAIDETSSRSFSEAHLNVSSTETTCGMESIVLGQIHQAKDVIMVKNEINVDISDSDGAARTWRAV